MKKSKYVAALHIYVTFFAPFWQKVPREDEREKCIWSETQNFLQLSILTNVPMFPSSLFWISTMYELNNCWRNVYWYLCSGCADKDFNHRTLCQLQVCCHILINMPHNRSLIIKKGDQAVKMFWYKIFSKFRRFTVKWTQDLVQGSCVNLNLCEFFWQVPFGSWILKTNLRCRILVELEELDKVNIWMDLDIDWGRWLYIIH